jgi:hypothetical protein
MPTVVLFTNALITFEGVLLLTNWISATEAVVSQGMRAESWVGLT